MAFSVRLDPVSPGEASTAVYSGAPRSGLGTFVRTLVILVAWAAAFVAFLLAPLLVLGIAWLVALVVLAARQRGRASRTAAAAAAPEPHRFGAARADAEVIG
jgi:hypothetical protein